MRELRDISRLIPAKHIFYAVDACYSGLLLERAVPSLSPTAQGYLEVVTKRRVRQILTAGLKDQPVLEEAGHGVFTRRLLEGLNGKADQNSDGIITGLELGSWVASRVASSTENRQTPTFGTIEGDGQFVFMTARAVDPLYAERRNLKRMRAGLVRFRREAEEAKRMALEAARLTLEQGKRLADERRELEKLKREVASQTEIQERLRKTRLQKRKLQAKVRVPAIPVKNRIELNRLSPGVRYRISLYRNEASIEFSINGNTLSGQVIYRKSNKPIIIRWCYFGACHRYRKDKTTIIALPNRAPFAGDTFTTRIPHYMKAIDLSTTP